MKSTYLSGRTMKVRFKGHVGKEKDIQGGAGQGAPLGMWIFLFMIDRMGPKSSNVQLGEIITQREKKRESIARGKQKYVDDFTVLTSINLKRDLIIDTNQNREHPVPFRSRTGHTLPTQSNPLQQEMNNILAQRKQRQ